GRERAIAQQAQHDAADRTGGADDGHAQPGHENSPNGRSTCTVSLPDSSNAACSARTASGTRSPAMTQEILIGEVEIILMLMSSAPRVEKTFAATPGCVRIPA